MSPSDRRQLAQLQEALLVRRARQSLRLFVELAWPVLEPATPFLPNWHLDLMCEYLEAVTAGDIRQLVINIPPRYGKSLLVSVLWPCWEWIVAPSTRWLFVSYSEGLACRHALDRLRLLRSDFYLQHWGDVVRLVRDQQAKLEFHNRRRGMMVATSIGGSLTGKGGNRLVLDDPHNPTQAESDVQRAHAIDFYRQTLSTRRDDPARAATVLVMQRLHVRDLTAVCLEWGFAHLCLPALAPTRTTILFPRSGRQFVREPDSPLWPAHETHAQLQAQRVVLGSYGFAGQYQQEPVPRTGGLFARGWWRFFLDAPTEFDDMMASWDLAFKDGAGNDFVVGLVAVRVGTDVYVLDRFKAKVPFVETCRAIETMQRRYPRTSRVLIEDAANGPAVINALHQRIACLIAVRPEGGKTSRAQSVQPLIEAGHVFLPQPRLPDGRTIPGREWVDDFIDTCAAFPKGDHDDDVDALTQLLVAWQAEPEDPWLRYAREELARMRGEAPPPLRLGEQVPDHHECRRRTVHTWEETGTDGTIRVRCRSCRRVLEERRA